MRCFSDLTYKKNSLKIGSPYDRVKIKLKTRKKKKTEKEIYFANNTQYKQRPTTILLYPLNIES